MKRVDKILGADIELGNARQSPSARLAGNDDVASLLLSKIDGIPGRRTTSSHHFPNHTYHNPHVTPTAGFDPQDWGRKFLDNGSCFYIDMGHLEACVPEVRGARAFVAAHHANLRIAREACRRANAALAPGERIVVMANNSDRMDNSWGGHLNVLVSRDLWEQTFDRMLPTLFVLAAFQVSSIVYTGQGKVGAENGRPWVPFQLTQRGDFFECLAALQTTYRRPICNTRDEAHVGAGSAASDLARMHIIFFDTTLTHGSNFLRAGVIQLVLAMLEAGWCDTSVLLDNPVAALTLWGHDPDLGAVAHLYDGRRLTAVEHQKMFAHAARQFVDAGEAHFVPDAEHILALWEDTLDKLESRDFNRLARRLDWAMKRALLTRMIDRDPNLDWHSPEIRAADLLFASLDEGEGLYWAIEAAGGTEQIASENDISRAMREPPDDTRAWTRTMLLREFGRRGIESVDWDEIRLRPGVSSPAVSVRLDDPRRFGRNDVQRVAEFETAQAHAALSN
jgi:proteasome accessory factor A